MMQIAPELLQRIVSDIVREVAPEQVILFGSHARESAGPDSDLDLLVVESEPFGQDRSRRTETRRIRRALWDYLVPMDILVYSRAEVEQWKGSKNHLIARTMKEGKVLYARP